MRKTLSTLTLAAVMLAPTASSAALTQLTDLFVFGDSLSDGGNSGLATQAYAGVTFPPAPYADGRYSNGPTAVEYLWQLYNPGSTSFKPSLAGGTNYAIGGATSGLVSFNQQYNDNVPPALRPAYANLGTAWQISAFQSQAQVFNPATSLFVVWLFPNDVFNWSASGGQLPGTSFGGAPSVGDAASLIGNGVANIVQTVGFLASVGATNILVPNMPDLGALPSTASLPDAPALSLMTASFNAVLKGQLDALAGNLPGLNVVQFDTAKVFADAIADPAAFGFTDATRSCVANLANGQCNPATWLFWDGAHPTTRGHALLAEGFHAAVVPEPQTWMLMALGLAGVGWVRRSRPAMQGA